MEPLILLEHFGLAFCFLQLLDIILEFLNIINVLLFNLMHLLFGLSFEIVGLLIKVLLQNYISLVNLRGI